MSRPRWLTTADGPEAFPALDEALTEPNGLIALGGDLSPERLLAAYPKSIFPWYEQGQPILWWSPDPRAVLWLNELHLSRRLARRRRRLDLRFSSDTCFELVVESCAAPRRYADSTWITQEMNEAYCELHRLGWAHSVEAWRDEELVGGIYGIAIGRVFFGESMFSKISDASKIVLGEAVEFLTSLGFALIDCQVRSSHLESLGATTIPRAKFVELLDRYCTPPGNPGPWTEAFNAWARSR
ncbi:MAG TPA: leucyl/phenylalanyl-tRNA--protein transferase [Gammaproteobacteria bacterium]